MTQGWEKLPLGRAGVVLLDCDHKTPEAVLNGRPYIGIPQMTSGRIDFSTGRQISEADFVIWTRKTKYQHNDVVLSRRTNPGVTAIDDTRTEFALGQNLVLLRANGKRVEPAFLRWLVRTPEWWEQIAKYTNVGAVFSSLRCRDVPHFELTIPPLPDQRIIAATLGALDDKIELNRRMNETLEAMARALFRDWFVDFGPTRAKMSGTAPYLSDDLWSLFPDCLDADGKPDGWRGGTVNDLAKLNPESWTARNPPEKVAYVDLANTKWGSIDNIEPYDWKDAPSRAKRILRLGDTIVGTVRPGNGSFSYIGEDGLTGSTGFAVLRPNSARDRAFVWCAATSPENIDRLTHLADGGAYPAVRPEAVASTEIVVPSVELLDAFCHAAAENLVLVEANKAESRTLAKTRNLLLPRLMSGELRLAEAEQLVEAAQ